MRVRVRVRVRVRMRVRVRVCVRVCVRECERGRERSPFTPPQTNVVLDAHVCKGEECVRHWGGSEPLVAVEKIRGTGTGVARINWRRRGDVGADILASRRGQGGVKAMSDEG